MAHRRMGPSFSFHSRGHMRKVIQFTMMLEITDDGAHPEEWDWHGLIADHVPHGVEAFSLVSSEHRPYACMEEDPASHPQKH